MLLSPFRHFFAKLLLQNSFCGRVKYKILQFEIAESQRNRNPRSPLNLLRVSIEIATFGGAQKGVDKRGLSPNPFTFMEGHMTGFEGARPLRSCNPDGIRSGIRMAGFGGTWRDLTGFGGFWRVLAGFGRNRFFTVFLLACKHSVQRRVSAWQANLAQIRSFPSSCARRDSDSAPFCQPPFGLCRNLNRNDSNFCDFNSPAGWI